MPDIDLPTPPTPGAEPPGLPSLGLVERAWLAVRGFLFALPYRLGWLLARLPSWIWSAIRAEFVGFWRTLIGLQRWLHMAEEREAVRQMEHRDMRAKAKIEINAYARRWRVIPVSILGILLAVGNLVLAHGWEGRYSWLLAVELLLVASAFEFVGFRRPPEDDSAPRRAGPLTHGTSSRTLRRDLVEGFEARKMSDVGVQVTVNRYGWHGVFETEAPIDDKLIEHLERWVHAPAGSLLVTADPRNAAARPFKLLIEDPLAQPDRPDDGPRDLDIRHLQRIGRHLFGQALVVNLRQHIGLVGRSGSGKSSGLWVLIDRIDRCANAEIDGIDLSSGPALPVWRSSIRRRGTTPEEAHSILDEALELATYRNAELARLAESDDADDLDENWNPMDGVDANGRTRRARYVAIDEFHIVSDDKDLLEKVKLLIRIGRKGCVFLILATPGASKEDLGSVVIKSMIGLKLLFACVIHDVTQFLGGRMAELGWRPDKLAPAASGAPKDAGKAYLWDGDHQEPEVVRIGRLDANECRRRARARAATPESKTGQGDARDVLAAAFEHFGRKAIPTRWLGQYLTDSDCDWSLGRLQAELRELGVTTSQVGQGPWGGNTTGYKAS